MGDSTFGPYGPVIVAALKDAKLNSLAPGKADASARASLSKLSADSIAAPHALVNRPMAMACLAGLWLRWDFLDESHRISQELDSTTGSFWHGIMHRREGDFENAKYWFRRVGAHPVFTAIAAKASTLAADAKAGKEAEYLLADYLLTGGAWDPFRFVDLCRAAADDTSPLGMLCRKIQQAEWELLFDYCHREAIGR